MRVIAGAMVKLVGYMTIDNQALGEFMAEEGAETWTTDTDVHCQKLVEVAGRLCYKSYSRPRPGGNKAYLDHIVEVGHGSVIEHAVYSLIFTGISRSLSHELVRHRAGWAYSQRSQRYCDESDLGVVLPPLYGICLRACEMRKKLSEKDDRHFVSSDEYNSWVDSIGSEYPEFRSMSISEYHAIADMGEAWNHAVETSRAAYAKLSDFGGKFLLRHVSDPTLRRKKAREAARSVLPNATETQIFVTVNARAARHFIELRGAADADSEIRSLALELYRTLEGHSPALFADYHVSTLPGIGEVIRCDHAKI